MPRTEIVRDQRCNKTVRTVSRLNRKTNLNRSRAPRASNEEQMRTPIVIQNPKGGTFRPRSNTPPCLDFRTQIIYLYISTNKAHLNNQSDILVSRVANPRYITYSNIGYFFQPLVTLPFPNSGRHAHSSSLKQEPFDSTPITHSTSCRRSAQSPLELATK